MQSETSLETAGASNQRVARGLDSEEVTNCRLDVMAWNEAHDFACLTGVRYTKETKEIQEIGWRVENLGQPQDLGDVKGNEMRQGKWNLAHHGQHRGVGKDLISGDIEGSGVVIRDGQGKGLNHISLMNRLNQRIIAHHYGSDRASKEGR